MVNSCCFGLPLILDRAVHGMLSASPRVSVLRFFRLPVSE